MESSIEGGGRGQGHTISTLQHHSALKGIQREQLNHSVLEMKQPAKLRNNVNFTDQKGGNTLNSNTNKTTDDLVNRGGGVGGAQFSKSIGPTNYSTHFSNLNQSSLENSQLQLPNISNNCFSLTVTLGMSRQQVLNQFSAQEGGSIPSFKQHSQAMDLHQILSYGPMHKKFLQHNKKAVQKYLRSSMRETEPFKGYIEISNASQHLKKHQQKQLLNDSQSPLKMMDGSIQDESSFMHQRGGGTPQPGAKQSSNYAMRKPIGYDNDSDRDQRDLQKLGISSKVMETWINETLADAEHLDIPGVILKPEHKNPISRYGIDRITLTNAGIPNATVDRVYRCLFVYSVGFYELIKKILAHCQKKYSVITAIWKVFSVMLEYCCQSDYRMLISEITNQHKEEIVKMEVDFQQKCQEFLNNEKILKQNMEVLQKYSEELEKERTNERTLRLKLEEEYMQNSKNHEEEVQLRLKFESKLNSMHSMHRELEIKHKRALNDLASAQMNIMRQEKIIEEQNQEIIHLKTSKAENEARIELLEEKKATLEREVGIKNKLVQEIESKMRVTQDENDLLKYQLHEQSKTLTEHRLKIDCLETKIEGLKNEKMHLEISLGETKEFKQIFEDKNKDMKTQYAELLVEFNENKQRLIGFEELLKEANEKIEAQKKELATQHQKLFEVDRQASSLRIELDKIQEYYKNTKSDLDETIERLHQTNRVRHELELKLQAEKDANQKLRATLDEKMNVIYEREKTIDMLDLRCKEQSFKIEQLVSQIENLERSHEVRTNQFQEKIESLNEIIKSEKEAREMWADRYEKEQKDHTQSSTEILVLKSRQKDTELEIGNIQIKYDGQVAANEQLQESNNKLQNQINDQMIQMENMKREIATLSETFKQVEQAKREMQERLNQELEKLKEEWMNEENQMGMISEDYRSRVLELLKQVQTLKLNLGWSKEEIEELTKSLQELQQDSERTSMINEDLWGRLMMKHTEISRFEIKLEESEQNTENERLVREKLKDEFAQRVNELEKEKKYIEDQYEDAMKQFEKERNKLYTEMSNMSKKQEAISRQGKQQQVVPQQQTQFKPLMKSQEVQTVGNYVVAQDMQYSNEESNVYSEKVPSNGQDKQGSSSRKQEVVDSRESRRNGQQVEQSQQQQPGNKLINQAQKRRDSMNKKLMQQQQQLLQKQGTVNSNKVTGGGAAAIGTKETNQQQQIQQDQQMLIMNDSSKTQSKQGDEVQVITSQKNVQQYSQFKQTSQSSMNQTLSHYQQIQQQKHQTEKIKQVPVMNQNESESNSKQTDEVQGVGGPSESNRSQVQRTQYIEQNTFNQSIGSQALPQQQKIINSKQYTVKNRNQSMGGAQYQPINAQSMQSKNITQSKREGAMGGEDGSIKIQSSLQGVDEVSTLERNFDDDNIQENQQRMEYVEEEEVEREEFEGNNNREEYNKRGSGKQRMTGTYFKEKQSLGSIHQSLDQRSMKESEQRSQKSMKEGIGSQVMTSKSRRQNSDLNQELGYKKDAKRGQHEEEVQQEEYEESMQQQQVEYEVDEGEGGERNDKILNRNDSIDVTKKYHYQDSQKSNQKRQQEERQSMREGTVAVNIGLKSSMEVKENTSLAMEETKSVESNAQEYLISKDDSQKMVSTLEQNRREQQQHQQQQPPTVVSANQKQKFQNKKVTGQSNIKTILRAVATRD